MSELSDSSTLTLANCKIFDPLIFLITKNWGGVHTNLCKTNALAAHIQVDIQCGDIRAKHYITVMRTLTICTLKLGIDSYIECALQ